MLLKNIVIFLVYYYEILIYLHVSILYYQEEEINVLHPVDINMMMCVAYQAYQLIIISLLCDSDVEYSLL